MWVIVSDSHGRNEVFSKLREKHPTASAYICCGDTECGYEYLDGFVTVQGNNDYGLNFPHHLVLNLDGHKVFVVHGDRIPPLTLLDRLKDMAKAEHCDVCLYGHTHIFHVDERDGVTLINPGSISHNRDGSLQSYALVEIVDNKVVVTRVALDEPKEKKKGFFF